MSFWYTGALERLAKGQANFTEAGLDVRLKLLMTNTTADTDQDATNLAGITTLDEYDGAGYAEAALASQAVNRDDANNRAEITANSPVSFGSTVAAGTRLAAGALVYTRVDGTAANDWPIAWIDSGGFPIAGGGGPFELAINAEGLLQVAFI
jgi:hypothetical protein